MELSGKKINFLGDSITEGVGASAPDKVYHQVMLRKYGLAAVRNYGISGTRYARQINPTLNEPSFDLDFCQRYAGMDDDADIVVVFGGTNDFGHGDAPIGTPDDRTPDTFWGACHYLYSHLIEKYPAALIVVHDPAPPSERAFHKRRRASEEVQLRQPEVVCRYNPRGGGVLRHPGA